MNFLGGGSYKSLGGADCVFNSRKVHGSIIIVGTVLYGGGGGASSVVMILIQTVYMLGAKCGFAQSVECAAKNHGSVLRAKIHGFRAHSMDRAYLRAQSTNPWTIHGLHCANN